MTDDRMRSLLPFVYDRKIEGLSDAGMDALARMLLAVNDLVCVTRMHDLTARSSLMRRIDALFEASDRNSLSGLCRMYRLTKEATMSVYGEKDEACSKLFYTLMDAYVERPEPDCETQAMRCVVYELGPLCEESTDLDYYGFFRNTCRKWAYDMDENGCWNGIGTATAFERIGLMQAQASIFRDDVTKENTERAFRFYSDHTMLPVRAAADDLPWLGACYDLLHCPATLSHDAATPARIAQLMEAFASADGPEADDRYTAWSYAVAQYAAERIERAVNEALENEE